MENVFNKMEEKLCLVGRFLSLVFFRSKGVILNISSASGMYPVPLLTVYSATKVRLFMTSHQTVHVC